MNNKTDSNIICKDCQEVITVRNNKNSIEGYICPYFKKWVDGNMKCVADKTKGKINPDTEEWHETVKRLTGKADNVNHPNHYKMGNREVIDIIKDVTSNIHDGFNAYCVGNVVKYICRHEYKGGIEDIKKAKKYLEFIIEKGDLK